MAKTKSKKKNLSEAKFAKAKPKTKNPFEVHVNRQKFNVLGRISKTDVGLPGVARAKSLKKRKETLLQEYKIKNKSNKFLDKRIGEKNTAMTDEDKIIARFTAERMKNFKKTMYNLGDDEVLTHKGRSLAEIENDDPRSDDDNDYGHKGLDANFVEEAHFGGGLLKKAEGGRAAVIEQLIADSKTRKAEKAREKEKNIEITDKLDSEWKDLLPFLANKKPEESEPPEKKMKKDQYDVLLNELKFEARGTPQDRMKSENEVAAEEAKKLSELEEERLRRMRGDVNEKVQTTSKHRSADDLDDGFDIEDETDYVLTYDKEGKPVGLQVEDIKSNKKSIDSLGNASESDDSNSEEESDDDDDDDEEEEGPENLSDLKVGLEEEEKDPEPKEEPEPDAIKENKDQKKKKVTFNDEPKVHHLLETKVKTPEDLEKEKNELKLIEKAKNELPYTFVVHEEYSDFLDLMKPKTVQEQMIVIERMIKCNHPSLLESNKIKMERLFGFLIKYLDEDHDDLWKLSDGLNQHLYALVHFSSINTTKTLLELLNEKHLSYRKKKSKYPSASTLNFLKVIATLYPASDKWHIVTTPSVMFIADILKNAQVLTRRSISSGLFLATLLTQYVQLSKRILPESINFLAGILHMATPAESGTQFQYPFKKEQKFLYLQESDKSDYDLKMFASDISIQSKVDNSFRIRSINTTLKLILSYYYLYKDIVGIWLLFQPIYNNLKLLEVMKYPIQVKELANTILDLLETLKNKGFSPVSLDEKKPKALRLYEPDVQKFNGKKNKEKDERSKLVGKYKKEMKGALREIRRDRTFLATVKFKEQAESDAERLKRVKQIYSWGAQQQGELNKLERKKKRNKF